VLCEVNEEFEESVRLEQAQGFNYFVDLTNDVSKVIWKDFIGLTEHENGSGAIGAYPTGFFCFHHDKDGNQELWRPDRTDPMDNYYLCHGLGTRIQIFNTIMRACDPAKYANWEAEFIEVDKNRIQHDCQYRNNYYSWNDYDRNGKLKKSGTYDRFWGALWPRQ
jgi:hypothetical protein